MSILSEDEFELYKPQQNHLDNNAGWNGWLYETYGEQEAYVREIAQKNPQRVWTLLEGDEGMTIVAGFHYVNRMGYIITKRGWVTATEEVPQDI